jgi:hypothetical protein
MSYNSVTVHLYPFHLLPNIDLAHAYDIPGSQYFEYADAIHLCEEDQAILQAMYIWIQTYFLSSEGTPMALSPYTSYSELWWLTKLYEKLRVILSTFDGRGFQPSTAEHCELYNKAMNDFGLSNVLLKYEILHLRNEELLKIPDLSYHTMTRSGDLGFKVVRIARVLSKNAEVSQDFHTLSSRRRATS